MNAPLKEISTTRAARYVVHWVSKKHWSKPGFDYDTSDVPSIARRAKNLEEAADRARQEIASGAAVRDQVEIYGLDREGDAVAVYWIKEDGTVAGMDMDG